MGQQVKDPALSLPWLGPLLRSGFDPWPGNIHVPQAQPKKKEGKRKNKRKKKNRRRGERREKTNGGKRRLSPSFHHLVALK